MARIKHIALTTSDPARAAAFYKEAFGLKELRRSARGAVFLTDGYINLAILNYKTDKDADVGAHGANFDGIHHFGFEVDDLDDIKRRLKETGFNAEIDSKSDKDSDHRIQDPDGHWVDMAVHRRWPK